MSKITVSVTIHKPLISVWEKWTQVEHVQHWNFAHESWFCPDASSEFKIGGEFHYQMAARDGSFSFDFWGTYQEIVTEKYLKIMLGDGREMEVLFEESESGVLVTEIFDPENQNPVEMQQQGWQAILNNFKAYVESV